MMTKIAAAFAVVLLLVAGGLWLSREQGNPGTVTAQGAETTTEAEVDDEAEAEAEAETSEASDTEEANEQEPSTEDVAETDSEAITTLPELPEGYVFTALLSDNQVQQFEAAEDVLEPDTDYQAIVVTSKGTMRLNLFQDEVPVTVNNFVFLALHKYYDGIVFHRVLEGFMAQTGDPTGTGRGGPGYQFQDEILTELRHEKAGILSMANAGPNTNGSQFFITFAATPWLDGAHTVFGEVIEGTEVLDVINRIDPGQPSAILLLTDTLAEAAEQGIILTGEPDSTIEAYLLETLSVLPDIGESFNIEGYDAVSGRIDQALAIGIFAAPDVMEAVYIIQQAKGEQ